MRLRSFSLTDIVELSLSGEEEENEDDFVRAPRLGARAAPRVAGREQLQRRSQLRSCGDSQNAGLYNCSRERAGRSRRYRPTRRSSSRIDLSLSRTTITREQIPCLLALRGAGDLLFETTRLILRTHRKRSRQAILHMLLET